MRLFFNGEPFLEKFLSDFRIRKIRPYISADKVICDIGCGRHTALLKAISGISKKCIGIDKKMPQVSHVNIEVRNYELNDTIPLEDECIDIVTMLAVLEHIENEREMIREIRRILKPGGVLLITVPSRKAEPIINFLAFKLHFIDEEEVRDHKRYYTTQTLKDVLLKNGFPSPRVEPFQCGFNLFAYARKPF